MPEKTGKITFSKISKKDIKKKNKFLHLFLFFFVGGYLIFFTSRSWLQTDNDLVPATKLNKILSFQDRDISVGRWDYSEEQKLMEVEINIQNHSSDGRNTYTFSALEKNKGYLDIEVLLEKPDLVILHIRNVPAKWRQISLRMGIDTDAAVQDVLKVYTNRSSVTNVANIEKQTETEYRIVHIEGIIKVYENEISTYESEIEEIQNKTTNLTQNITELEESKQYQTDQEQEETDQQIAQAESEIENLEREEQDIQDTIDEYIKRIENLKIQESDLKKG